jgi:hypothetical protein
LKSYAQSISKKIKPDYMGTWCLKCGKVMKNPKNTHCSDECLLADIKKSKTLNPDGRGAEKWNDESDPWV